MDRPKQRARLTAVVGIVCLIAAVTLLLVPSRPASVAGEQRQPRLGTSVTLFDDLLAAQGHVHDLGALRRQYDRAGSRLLLDLTASGRVRQITIGRERSTPETWNPDPDDWSLAQAERMARSWLPPDASLRRTEPFSFRQRMAGRVEVYACPSLRAVFSPEEAASLGARSPGDMCAVTYYQTETGGVAFALVGLY